MSELLQIVRDVSWIFQVIQLMVSLVCVDISLCYYYYFVLTLTDAFNVCLMREDIK